MPQNFSINEASNNVELIKDTSQFNKNFIKNYSEERDEGYFF